MLSITFDECATALLPYVLPGLLYNKNVDWPKLEQASIYFVDKILRTFGTIVHQTKTLLTKEILSILIHTQQICKARRLQLQKSLANAKYYASEERRWK